MMSDLDREITRAVREVVDAAPPARPFENLRDRPDRMGSLSPGWRRRGALVVACSAMVVAGVVAMVVVGSESGNDAPTSGLPSTLPATVPAVAPPQAPSTADTTVASTPVTGAAPVAIGASVMLGAAPELTDQGFAVDAEESRQFADVLNTINALHASSQLGNVVVVDAGDNGTIQPDDLDTMMGALSDVERVVMITGNSPQPWIAPNNDLLRSLPARYANVVVANWDVDAAHCPGQCFYEDGFHLRPDGGAHYAQVLTDAAKIDGFGDIPVLQACQLDDRAGWNEATNPPQSGPLESQELRVRSVTTADGDIAFFARAGGRTISSTCQPAATYALSLDQGLSFLQVTPTSSGVVFVVAFPSELVTGVDDIGLGEPASTFVGNGLTTVAYLVADDRPTTDLTPAIARALTTAREGTDLAGGIDLAIKTD